MVGKLTHCTIFEGAFTVTRCRVNSLPSGDLAEPERYILGDNNNNMHLLE
jgi:hypothetical protein